MNNSNFFSIARQQLCDAISNFQTPTCDPLKVSPWIAMSLLQKAIRRGRKGLAMRAAATLLLGSPERLWRRIACIAFEDIGAADFDAVVLVTAALAGKRFRQDLGGEWSVASFLISRMADAAKCRDSDDLLLAAENHPDFDDTRLQFAFRNTQSLARIAIGDDPLPIRALAVWYAIGTNRRPSTRLSLRDGSPTPVFNALRKIIPPSVVEIAHEAHRKTGEVLCLFVALLWPLHEGTGTFEDDEFPPAAMIREVPGWAYDIYSREGRAALANFIEGQTETAWVSIIEDYAELETH
jgi:hypothetical protein